VRFPRTTDLMPFLEKFKNLELSLYCSIGHGVSIPLGMESSISPLSENISRPIWMTSVHVLDYLYSHKVTATSTTKWKKMKV
jgi:hypothetical protein